MANPRTTMPFHFISCHLSSVVFQTAFKPNSNRWVSGQCQVGMIWLLHLALVMARETFRTFSGLFTDPFLPGIIGAFLHIRCIPHQNSQRLFWASVWNISIDVKLVLCLLQGGPGHLDGMGQRRRIQVAVQTYLQFLNRDGMWLTQEPPCRFSTRITSGFLN